MTDPNILFKEQMAKARRAQILDAAATVFAKKGFHRATTKEIAKAASVSPGTIYNYFGSKDDLLIGLMARLGEVEQLMMKTTPEMLEQALPGDPRDFFNAIHHARQDFVLQNMAMLRAVLSEILINRELGQRYYQELVMPGVALMEQHLEARIEQGQIRSVNVPLVVRFLFAINLGLFGLLIIGDPMLQSEWESDDLVEALVSFLFDGLGPREEAQE